jgi:hypothetical protein
MGVRWLDGAADLGFDPSIMCPPRTRADVERQADAAWRVLRWIGIRDRSASATTFAVWDMRLRARPLRAVSDRDREGAGATRAA